MSAATVPVPNPVALTQQTPDVTHRDILLARLEGGIAVDTNRGPNTNPYLDVTGPFKERNRVLKEFWANGYRKRRRQIFLAQQHAQSAG